MNISITIAYTGLLALGASIALSAAVNIAKFLYLHRHLKSRAIKAYVDRTGYIQINVRAKSMVALKLQSPSIKAEHSWFRSVLRKLVGVDSWFSMHAIPSTLDSLSGPLVVEGHTTHDIFGKADPKTLDRYRTKFIRAPVLRVLVNGHSDIVSLDEGDKPVVVKRGPGCTVTLPKGKAVTDSDEHAVDAAAQ